MRICVQKYGGSSVADAAGLHFVAERVARTVAEGWRVCVVVSAMGDTTNRLLAQAREVSDAPDRRELDMLLSAGERISMALLAMALRKRGVDAISFTGSQSGIVTNDRHVDARIIEVRPHRIEDELERGRCVIVAGFQGVSYKREVTTLGRGGSDTTAVALAAALGAEHCEICSDVDGVYTADPRVVPAARRIDALSHEEMQEMAEAGAKVLNAQCVEFAKRADIAIYARATRGGLEGTVVRKDPPSRPGRVVAVTSTRNIVRVAGDGGRAQLGRVLALLDAREAEAREVALGGDHFSLLLPAENLHDAAEVERLLTREAGASWDATLGAVSLIGTGINQRPDNVLRLLARLDALGVPAAATSTSSFRITALVPRAEVDRVVRDAHVGFIEGAPEPVP